MTDENWSFVIAAYAVTWVVVAGYWLRVHRALRRARRAFEHAAGRPEES